MIAPRNTARENNTTHTGNDKEVIMKKAISLALVLIMALSLTACGDKEGTGNAAQTGDKVLDWWNGDWYGWWVIYEGGGEYADLESYCYDACATISVYGDTGLVDLWDEDCTEGMNIGYIDVAFEPGTTDKGRMVSVSGDFYDDEIAPRDWVVDPGDSFVSRFDSMILIDGTYYEDGNSSNWIHYFVFLRPWGMSWEDVRSDSCYDMPYDNMMPLGYDSWYVPHMNDAMPSYIDLDRGEAA